MTVTGGTENKKKAAANFNLRLASLDKNDLVAYTDGSQKLDEAGKILDTRSAWILRWKERWLGINGFSLGPKAEGYDAEILGLCGGLEAALTSPIFELISGIYICRDNQLGVYQTDLVKLDLPDLKRQFNVGFKMGEG